MTDLDMPWRLRFSTIAMAAVLAGCGGDGPASIGPSADDSGANGAGRTGDVNVCTIVPEADLLAAMDSTASELPSAERTGPSGPFTGCSWGTGWILVQVAEADGLILPPVRLDGCVTVGIGDAAESCPGQVSFFVNGIHTSVSTLDPHPQELLIAVAELFLPYVQDL